MKKKIHEYQSDYIARIRRDFHERNPSLSYQPYRVKDSKKPKPPIGDKKPVYGL